MNISKIGAYRDFMGIFEYSYFIISDNFEILVFQANHCVATRHTLLAPCGSNM